MTRKYGHIKDTRDYSHLKIRITEDDVKKFQDRTGTTTAPTVDLRTVYNLTQTVHTALSDIDQGQLGSCTANSIATAYALEELKQHNDKIFLPARLFIYYNERLLEGTVDEDAGAMIADGIKTLNLYGVIDEHQYEYDPLKFTLKPPQSIYTEAKLATAVKYANIDFSADNTLADRVAHLKRTINSGYPFVLGFIVYESFESEEVAQTGLMPMPNVDTEQVLGGHAVCAVGYNDSLNSFIIKNSWGPNWGVHGYFYMPYNFIGDTSFTSDFWIIEQVTNPDGIINFTSNDIFPDQTDLDIAPTVEDGNVVHN